MGIIKEYWMHWDLVGKETGIGSQKIPGTGNQCQDMKKCNGFGEHCSKGI